MRRMAKQNKVKPQRGFETLQKDQCADAYNFIEDKKIQHTASVAA